MRLHDRPYMPGHKLVIAEAEILTFGLLSGSGVQNQAKYGFAHLLNAGFASNNKTAVNVHIIAHALIQFRIGCQL